MNVGLMFNPFVQTAITLAQETIEYLKGKCDLVIEKFSANHIGMEGIEIERMNIDVLITIGGDGTILRALQHTKAKILGINSGVLGFLTEVNPANLRQSLDAMLSGDYSVDRRIKLKSLLNGKRVFDATNEAVIHTAHVAKMRHFKVLVDGKRAAIMRADGLIISTPTGSTCYAMSVGSPIIDPRVEAFVVVPIAPFKMSARPIVVPATSKIAINLLERERESLLVLDGQEELDMAGEDVLECTISEHRAEFIRFNYNFYQRVDEKLIVSSVS